jgi:hypothetical protein
MSASRSARHLPRLDLQQQLHCMRLTPAVEPVHLMGISTAHMTVTKFVMKKSMNNRLTCSPLVAKSGSIRGRTRRDQLVYDSPFELVCHAANNGA